MPDNWLIKKLVIPCFGIFLFFFQLQTLTAQIISPYADATASTNYLITIPNDSIYVFNASGESFYTKRGSLKVFSPDYSRGWTFTWFQYNSTTKVFDTLPETTIGNVSVLDNLESGGYKVKITKNNIDTSFRAWVFINKLRMAVYKDSKGDLPLGYYTCSNITLSVIPADDQNEDTSKRFFHQDFIYYDLGDPLKKQLVLKNDSTVVWTAKPALEITNYAFNMKIYNPPAKDTKFICTVSDKFNNTDSDNVVYKTIVSKPVFEILIDTVNAIESTFPQKDKFVPYDTTQKELEPVVYAKFVNLSIHANKFHWVLSNHIFSLQDSINANYTTTDSTFSPQYIYLYPDTYKVRLFTTSPEGCLDSSDYKQIILKNSEFPVQLPEVFDPQDSGIFTIKLPKMNSIRQFHLLIFNRLGSKVYEFNGQITNDWKGGWNGNINNRSRPAPPGIYFYVAEIWGWGNINSSGSDNSTPPSKYMKTSGFVYLIRNQ
jgi:hypothetical protein